MTYDAFISYSRAADDDLAPDLQRSLERLSRPWYRRKPFLRILRDTTSFGASADLNQTIASSLDESNHLILLVSPESARSPWTTQEVAHWLDTKGPDSITTVITGWSADDDLPSGQLTDLNEFDWKGPDVPPALREVADEPLAVDLRWADGEPAHRNLDDERWLDAIAQIAAGVKGVKKDELIGELVALKTRARVLTTSVALGLAIVLAAAVVGFAMFVTADRKRDEAESDRDAAVTEKQQAESDRDSARLQEAAALEQADLQTAIAGVRTQANAAARLIGTDVTGALHEALGAVERARQVAIDFPDSDAPTGELQARGVILEALLTNPDLVANIDGNFGGVEAGPDGDGFLLFGDGWIWRVGDDGVAPAEPTWPQAMGAPMSGGRVLAGSYGELVVRGTGGEVERDVTIPSSVVGGLVAIAAGPHGRFVAAGTDQGTVLLWDLDDPSGLPFEWSTGALWVTDLSFHSGGGRDGGVLAWSGVSDTPLDAATPSAGLFRYDATGLHVVGVPALVAFEFEEVNQIGFAPGCGDICPLAATSRYSVPSIVEVSLDGTVVAESACPACQPGGEPVAWHANGTRLAYGDGRGGVEIWDYRSGEWTPTGTSFTAPRGPVNSLAFTGDDVLAATIEPGAVNRWRAVTAPPLATGVEPAATGYREWDALRAVAVHPDGGLLATGGSDAAIRLWDISRDGRPEPLTAWAPWCDPDCEGALDLIAPSGAADCDTTRGDRVTDVSFAASGLLAASGSHDSDCSNAIVRVFEVEGGELGRPVEFTVAAGAVVFSVAFDPATCGDTDGCLLLAGGRIGTRDGGHATVWAWRHSGGEWSPVGTLDLGTDHWINSVAFGDVGGRPVVELATSDVVAVWPADALIEALESGSTVDIGERALPGTAEFFVAASDPAGRGLIVSGTHGQLRVHRVELTPSGDIASAELVSTFGRFAAQVVDAEWSPDGQLVVAVSDDGTIRIFDLTVPDDPVSIVSAITAHEGPVWQVAIDPAGTGFYAVSHPAADPADSLGTLVRWVIGGDELTALACRVAGSVGGVVPTACG